MQFIQNITITKVFCRKNQLLNVTVYCTYIDQCAAEGKYNKQEVPEALISYSNLEDAAVGQRRPRGKAGPSDEVYLAVICFL
jgi:hypothetical protein